MAFRLRHHLRQLAGRPAAAAALCSAGAAASGLGLALCQRQGHHGHGYHLHKGDHHANGHHLHAHDGWMAVADLGEIGGTGPASALTKNKQVNHSWLHVRDVYALVTILNAIIDLPSFDEEQEHEILTQSVAAVLNEIEREVPSPYLDLCMVENEEDGLEAAEEATMIERLSESVVRKVRLPYLTQSCEDTLVTFLVSVVVGSMRRGESLETMLRIENAAPLIFKVPPTRLLITFTRTCTQCTNACPFPCPCRGCVCMCMHCLRSASREVAGSSRSGLLLACLISPPLLGRSSSRAAPRPS